MWDHSAAGRRSAAAGPVTSASLGAAIVLTGTQGIAPAIPAIQEQFSLGSAEVSLITSVYLLPSILSAFAAGVLGDRFGARAVFVSALLLYGAAGGFMFASHTIWLLLALRFVQGVAFGAVLALSVSIIGEVLPAGPGAARGQGVRSISMAGAEVVLPIAAGLLVTITWYAPFALQLLAVPIAVASWFMLPGVHLQPKVRGRASARAVLATPAFVGVQVLGAVRFVFKFAVLTYYPVLAVREAGMPVAVVGVVLGGSAVLTAVAAWSTERLVHRWSAGQLVGGCLVVIALGLAGMGASDRPAVLVLALLVFTFQDGVFSVAHNVLVAEMAPAGARSTYIGVSVTVRNVGKFVAPMLFGAMTLIVSLSQSFLVFAVGSLASILAARNVVRTQSRSAPNGGPTG